MGGVCLFVLFVNLFSLSGWGGGGGSSCNSASVFGVNNRSRGEEGMHMCVYWNVKERL